MRNRIEDFGRIAVLTDVLLDLDVWNLYQGRNKDFVDAIREMEEEKADDLLHSLIYGIDGLRNKLFEIRSIAYGEEEYDREYI